MDIISILTYFGFTTQNTTPLVVVAGVALFFVFKHTKPIRISLSEIREKFFVVESRVSDLWKDKIAPSHSPRQLNDRGEQILRTSGIKQIVDEKKDELLQLVKNKNVTNAYDAEMAINAVMLDLPRHCPDIVERLKQGAFEAGVEINTVLFAGSIYLRNLIFPDLNLSLEDLDKKGE